MNRSRLLLSLALLALLLPGLALADTSTPATFAGLLNGDALTKATYATLTLFLFAVLLESALALLFNWRPFVELLNPRAIRPLVAFLVALGFVLTYDFDAVGVLMEATKTRPVGSETGLLGKVLTAAILAGGSAGVNTVLVALGFRQVRNPATEAAQVPAQHAWIAVRVRRSGSAGSVNVHIGPPNPAGPPPLAATLNPRTGAQERRLLGFFLHDPNRFPRYGGYQIRAGVPCQVQLRGVDAGGQALAPVTEEFTPAERAIIDLEIPL